jgi:hypothetical protein
MNRSRTILIVALAGAATLLSASTAGVVLRGGGAEVKVSGTSTLHAWTVESTTLSGSIEIAPSFLTDATLATVPELQPGGAPRVEIVIPAKSLKSESARMDKVMWEALGVDAHPEIRFALRASERVPADDAVDGRFALATKGELTIAGRTREIALPVEVERNAAGGYVVKGELPLKMTDFGIKPPTALLGTVRAGDDVKVAFRWEVRPEAASDPRSADAAR